MAALTMQGHVTPGQDVGDRDQEFDPTPAVQVFDRQGRREADSDGPNKDSSATVIARTKPLVVSRNTARDGTRPKLPERPTFSKKPKVPGAFRFNTTRVVPGERRFGPGPLKKPPGRVPIVPKKTKPGVPTLGNKTLALTGRDPRVETSITEREGAKYPALMSGSDLVTNRQSSSEGQTLGAKEQPDVGMASHGNDTAPVSSEPTGTVQSQEKKCLNKIKVTHIRLPLKERGSGCRGDGSVLGGKTPGSNQGSSDTDESAETDVDYSPDPLHKLVKDTFNNLNITTFSVHLAKPSEYSDDAERVRMQILGGLMPLSSLSSSAVTSSPLSSSSSESPSAEPSTSASVSSSDESGSVGGKEPDIDYSKSTTDVASPEDRKVPPSGKGGVPLFRRTYVRRPRPNIGWFQNKTHPNLRTPHQTPHLNLLPARETEPKLTSTGELLSSTSSSASEESSVEVNAPARDTSGYIDGATAPASTGVEQNEKKMPPERGRTPLRRAPLKGAYLRNPNFGPLRNRTRPISRLLPPPSQPFPAPETGKEQVSHSKLPATSPPPVSKESYPAEGTGPIREAKGDRAGTNMSTDFSQTLRGSGAPSSHQPATKVGYVRRLYGGPYQNQNRTNLRLPQHPYRGPVRKPLPARKLNGGSGMTVRSQISQLEKSSTPEIPDNKSGEQVVTEVILSAQTQDKATVQTIKSGEEGTRTPDSYSDVHTERLNAGEDPGSTSRGRPSLKQTSDSRLVSERGDSAPVQTIKIGEKQTRTPDSNSDSDIYKERVNAGENTGSTNQGRLTLKQTSDSRPVSEGGDNVLVQTTKSGEEETRTPDSHSDVHKERVNAVDMTGSASRGRPTLKQTSDSRHGASKPVLELGDKAPVQTIKSGEEETRTPDTKSDSDNYKKRITAGERTGYTSRGRPALKPTSDSRHGGPRPVTLPKRQPPPRINPMRHSISGSQKTNDTAKRLTDGETERRSPNPKPLTGSDVSSSGVTREPLDYVGVTNRTSDGFTLTWDSPEGKYKNFVVTKKEVRKGPKQTEDQEDKEANRQPVKETEADDGRSEDENRVPESAPVPTAKPPTGSDETFKKVLLPGSARSFQFEDLPRQTEYTVTLLGKGPGLLSRLHKLVISTGPEPPTNIIFSKVTENSLTVSWTKPKSPISAFKVTYTHTEDGEPVSVSVDKDDSTLGLSQLTPGSTYEVSVISILGLDESDPVKDFVRTLPDPPTDLRAVNVTDTKALLLWRPALAAIDKYSIVYGSGTGSELRVSVSGNAAEQQLSGLEGSTTYTVTITSQLGDRESSPATTTFTTTRGSGGDGDRPQDLQARNVTPRTALLSWKPPSNPVGRYRLTYQTEGQEMKEVIVDASVTEYNLTRLHPASKYTVQLQAEAGGRYTAAVVTDFTTGTLRFPFPTDCSQELLNGIRTSGEVEIFPQGKLGTSMMVSCDMETDGGGWTVFQRRKDGSVDFFRGWKEYMRGFGDLSGEFWLGLDNLHNLTTTTRMTLRVDLRDKDESVFAKYSTFEVAKRNYRLSVGGYSGTAGDSLSYHNNRVFSTRDRDPAPFITRCAMSYRGGWWYKNCHEANLNGLYGIDVKHQGVIWTSWKGKDHSIPFTEMKMRPAAFSPIRG